MSQRLQVPVTGYRVTQTQVPLYNPPCHKDSGVVLLAVSQKLQVPVTGYRVTQTQVP